MKSWKATTFGLLAVVIGCSTAKAQYAAVGPMEWINSDVA
jgi:hypothetical protein